MENKRGPFTRTDFLVGTTITTALGASLRESAEAAPPSAATTPEAAFRALKAGNRRFLSGNPTCGDLSNRRAQLVGGQSPFAIIVSCSDSRVPVETVFDQEPGHIFGVRVAGNFVDPAGLGSIEYAVAVLKSPFILVLGHRECGAVKAAIENVKSGKTFPGHIQTLVDALAPSAKKSKSDAGNWLENAIAQNVRGTIASLPGRSKIVGDAVSEGKLNVAGGVYDLATGRVKLLD